MMKEGALNELPGGWMWTRLEEACLYPQYGWTTSAKTEGALHLLRTTDITSGNIDWKTVPFCEEEPSEKEKYLLKDGDIVISRAGSVGYSYLVKNPKEAIFASYLIRFRPLIAEKYLAYFLKSPFYWNSISEKSLGIAIPNVNASKLKEISIPLPPLPEQRAIVSKIEQLFSDLDNGIENFKKAQAQLKLYRQSVLKAACEGKLVPTEAETCARGGTRVRGCGCAAGENTTRKGNKGKKQ
jgi:type I restriction enzyme S subunit